MKFDLANAYFQKREYSQALEMANRFQPKVRRTMRTSLCWAISTRTWETQLALADFSGCDVRNPDNDQAYLSLALLDLRGGDIEEAQQILLKGQARIPASGKLYWGLGLTAAMQGNTNEPQLNLSERSICCPSGREVIRRLASSTFKRDRSPRPEKCSIASRTAAQASLDIDRIAAGARRSPHR